eukprot:1104763_1
MKSVSINRMHKSIRFHQLQRYHRCMISHLHGNPCTNYKRHQRMMVRLQQQKLFCTQTMKQKPSRDPTITLFLVIVSGLGCGYFMYKLDQEQSVYVQYVLYKLSQHKTSSQYFFGDTSVMSDEEKMEMELMTSNSNLMNEWGFNTGRVLKIDVDVKSSKGVSGHVTATFKPLDRKIFKYYDENQKDEYKVLGRVVTIKLHTERAYARILDEQIVLFDIKHVQWEDRPCFPDDKNDSYRK